MQEARWQNPEDDIQNPQSSTSQGLQKASQTVTELAQAIPRVFPACTDWSIKQICKQRKDYSVADFKAHLDALFLRIQSSIQ